ncbi:MAG: DUF362 domain-containing protein [Phycisphaerae bacterium]|nr:DUF362 domain-containing protein [Phycisphaerae bacterium]
MPSQVFFGSAKQRTLAASDTLPAKLDLIINRLRIRDRVAKKTVAIKMHLGGNIGYSTIHPVFVRKVVQAVKDGGGKPFVTDTAGACYSSPNRGYSSETLGCPIYPVAGPNDKNFKAIHHPFKNITDWFLGTTMLEADFLINFAHVKGHPSCGFGALFKNLALGAMIGKTRGAIHDTCHFDPYFFPEKLGSDPAILDKIVAACPHQGLIRDKDNPKVLHLHFDNCNQCGRCLKVAPPGSLKIDPANFHAFIECNAIAVKLVLDHFFDGNATFLALANQLTPVCDCFGFTGPSILPDVGIFGGDDIVATEQAVLDETGKCKLIAENVPESIEIQPSAGHPFSQIHGPLKDPYVLTKYGEALGLGSRKYELVDVTLAPPGDKGMAPISATHM